MPLFNVPVTWEEYAWMRIEADTPEQAAAIAIADETPLPEGEYVDASMAISDYNMIEQL